MKRLLKISLTYLVPAIFIAILIYGLNFNHQIRCILVEYDLSSLRKETDNLYVSAGMDKIDAALLKENIEASRKRLSHFFDTVYANPVFLAGDSENFMRTYGAQLNSPGMNHITPIGSYIVLGPKGLNRDVISHELVHAELVYRVGWWNREMEIPTWFDEGLALMLDYRYKDSDAMWNILTKKGEEAPSLKELEKMKDFIRITQKSPYLSYVTSMREVSRWWNVVGLNGFAEFTDRIKNGEHFPSAYKETENKFSRMTKK
ncbi:DUF1570 domain-containing protein [Flexithrix dorotheae]|uniref:DUF1570 domain-containing protein n=1 Tax=Flexithrix dorotheae TaxID=70993 RepID=UPI00035C2682|nr:DUF1570 domain-containing protein [Flexithrix dorotheae]